MDFTSPTASHPVNDEDWMKLAYDAALIAYNNGEVPVGAVITCENKLLAQTYNNVHKEKNVLHHCELEAMRIAAKHIGDWRLHTCTLYVTKEPCPMCSGACVMARIGRVVFAVRDEKMGCLGGCGCDFSHHARFNHSFPCIGGVLEGPCLELLQKFFRRRRQENQSNRKIGK
jgi:tRNA(adenine34) deaminase